MTAITQPVPLIHGPLRFEGAISVEVGDGFAQPWRLPHTQLDLFHPALVARAASPSGVRTTCLSDTTSLSLDIEPQRDTSLIFDLLLDGKLAGRRELAIGETHARWDRLGGDEPRRMRRLELYLPAQYVPVRLRSLCIDGDAAIEPWCDRRRRWVIYGSSIEHARQAHGPSETWPADVARRFDLNLTNLGYGGNEHMEISVARMIRDLPADLITLCVGGNIWGQQSLQARTYRAALVGFVRTLRDRHPRVPISVVAFIHTKHDTEPRPDDVFTLQQVRQWTTDAVTDLRAFGDDRIFSVDGLTLFGPDDMPLMTEDRVHPGGEGQLLMARRFGDDAMPRMLAMVADR